ncbi:MucBP domain-containing protein [Enterococcus quebecensis]|uniref:MucBP domain-containing protein n=1 Tax=Enterococcus quebecensis TaxID=903983 RepID=A0A1E5GR11_9ENTE|nr:MucBP domain-containing protein [Enterococcus quebecensis]OEG15161.1 hypothetical protein BCR23_10000 [Enterococcus quebecensis]OJG74736.1 hypothetical protein RV12_GL002153 [Enterococcus quebecensis]
MKKIIASIFILITALFLLPLSSEAAQINFYDIDTLSPEEQETIIKDKPSISLENEQYNLVYQKSLTSSGTNDHTHSGNTSKPMNQSSLPKAGEIDHVNLLLYGSSFVAVSLFALYKRKKYSQLLLIIIIPATIGTTAMTALAAGDPLIPSENISIYNGEVKSLEPAVIEGYTYVGYYSVSETTLPEVESTVLVRYVDENNNELHVSQTMTGLIGENYDASTEKYKLPIQGYTLNETKLPTNAIGTFAEKEQTVVYEYKKEADNKGTLTVQYLDKNGDEILPSEVVTGELGQAFHIEKKEITNFLFEHSEGEIDGVFSTDEMVIKLYYTDEAKINIHYIDKNTKAPLVLNALKDYADYLRPDVSDIDDYYYTSSYDGKTYTLGSVVTSDQLTVKIGTVYTLPKEIRFLMTKPDGQTMETFYFPKVVNMPGIGLITAISSYSNFLYFNEQPEYIPENYTGTADQLEIDVTYEVTSTTYHIPGW